LLRGKPTRFDCREDELDRNLLFDIRPMLPGTASPSSPCEVRAVLVVADVSELRQARDALNELNASLETKVRTRTQELREANRGLRNEVVRRKAAETALLASNSERALLSEQLIVAQENERHRIARELHDAAGQSLSAVKYLIEQAIEMLRRPGLGDPLPALSQAVRSTLDASESIRTIATSLRPSILDDMGPASAVAGFCRNFAEVYRGIDVDIQVSATDEDVPDRLATALFRSAQELLNNVAKHAQATRVSIVLRREPLLLLLEVTDDGVGIVESGFTASPLHGHGIRNLRERSQLSGGNFELMNGAAGGTVARLSWPLLHDEVPERDEL
jgi:signal transduction histidine kinase